MAAGSEIGALFVRIGADVSGLKSGLNSAEKDAAGFTSRVNTGLLKGMAILATIGASIGAIAVGAYMKTEALGQSAFDMGEKFGISGGEASKWLSIAGQLGISSETIGTGLKFISKNMGNVQLALSHGHKPALLLTDAFSSLGVKLYDANGKLRSTTDVMNQVADKFATMPDGAMKTAAAVAIFGRSGSEMIPILNQGSAGLAAMTAQGIKLGTVMSTQQVEAIHKAYLAHQKFDQALAGLTNQIGIKLMPTMTKLFNYVVTTGIPAVEKFTHWIQTLGPQLKTASNTIKALAPYIAVLAGAWVVWNGRASRYEGNRNGNPGRAIRGRHYRHCK